MDEHPFFDIVPASRYLPEILPELLALRLFERAPVGTTTRLLAVGDVGFSGRVANSAAGGGYGSLLDEIRPMLQTGQIVFGNLETPLLADTSAPAMFTGPTEAAKALAQSGFTLLNLANNHIRDHGPQGLHSTMSALQSAGLAWVGAGQDAASASELRRTDCCGLRIGWLGCGQTKEKQSAGGPYCWEYDPEAVLAAVRSARPSVDVLVVSLHVGLMFLDYPKPEDKLVAERLREAGADLVLMHHAHVIQGVQVDDRRRVICYNLGNFLFDCQEGNVRAEVMVREQQEGAVFLFDLDREGVCRGLVLPTWTDENLRVRWATGEQAERILQRLARISGDLESNYSTLFEKQRAERNAGLGLKVLMFHLKRGNCAYVWQVFRRLRWEHCRMVWQWLLGRLRIRSSR